MSRSRGPVALAIIGAASFVMLAVLVATHATQGFDDAARGFFRPHDEWGQLQLRADVVVEGLKPRNIAPLLALVAIVVSLRRSSWRPVVYAATIGGAAGLLTVLSKLLLERPDTHNDVTWAGGSFPSGHTMSVLVFLGFVVLVWHERSRWWEWVVVTLVGLGMGLSLLVQAAHWFTDVIGGLLLALTVLATAATASRFRGPPPEHQRSATRSKISVES